MFEAWCLVEIMGHQRVAGKVTEESVFGTQMMQVDVPETAHLPAFTKYYGAAAIYAVTPVPEEVARAMAERLAERPWEPTVAGVALPAPSGAPVVDHIHQTDPDFDDDERSGDPDWEAGDLYDEDERDWEEDDEDDQGEDDFDQDKRAAAKWAYDLVHDLNGFAILDTETTGIDLDSDLPCQVAVIDQAGAVLLDTLVKPTFPIPAAATRIHGIDDAMVVDAPTPRDLVERLCETLSNRRLVIYNAGFDLAMLRNLAQVADAKITSPKQLFLFFDGGCAMQRYAAFHGDWNDYHGNYRWQKLGNALAQQGIDHVGTLHSALGDCQATLKVIQAMAAWYEAEVASSEVEA